MYSLNIVYKLNYINAWIDIQLVNIFYIIIKSISSPLLIHNFKPIPAPAVTVPENESPPAQPS